MSKLLLLQVLGFCTTIMTAWTAAALMPDTITSGHEYARSAYDSPEKLNFLDPYSNRLYCTELVAPGARFREWLVWSDGCAVGVPFPFTIHSKLNSRDPHRASPEDSFPRMNEAKPPFDSGWGYAGHLSLKPRSDWKHSIAGTEYAAGWPWLALWCQGQPPNAPWSHTYRVPSSGGLSSGNSASDRVLSYLLIWHGLLFNTLFYSTLWSILLFSPRAIRRHLRAKHHRCPTCNYDLRNLPTTTCPECGTPN